MGFISCYICINNKYGVRNVYTVDIMGHRRPRVTVMSTVYSLYSFISLCELNQHNLF